MFRNKMGETAYLSCPECGFLSQMPQSQLDKMDDYPECPKCKDGTQMEDEEEWECNICGDSVWRHDKSSCIFWYDNDTNDGDSICICKKCLDKKVRVNLSVGERVVEKIVEKPVEKIVYKYVDAKGSPVDQVDQVIANPVVGKSFGGQTKFD